MFRRKFIAGLSLATAGGLGAIGAAASAGKNRTVTYRVSGFTCITCAVGLDTMLSQQKGVVHSQSSYPDGTATIEFKPGVTSEGSLKAFISEMGFTAIETHQETK